MTRCLMLYVCRFSLVEGAGVMYGSLCFFHAALLYASLAKALTLMLCSLGLQHIGLQHIGLQLGLQHDFDVVLARFRSFKCRRL